MSSGGSVELEGGYIMDRWVGVVNREGESSLL